MGMFDEIKCSANIGELTNIRCQTKDIDNVLAFFWIDPAGILWTPDYSGTQDIHYRKDKPLFGSIGSIEYKPNGNKGKVRRAPLTKYVTIYDSKTSPDGYSEFIECVLHIVDGTLQSYVYK